MVFKRVARKFYIFLFLFLLSAPVQAQGWFDGIYISGRTGALVPHPYTIRVDVEGLASVDLTARVGFITQGAFGLWFNFFDVGRMRSEMEVGYQRYVLDGQPQNIMMPLTGDSQGRGAITALTFFWNNYFNFFPRRSDHQPWVGFGVGSMRWQRSYYYGENRNPPQQLDLSFNGAFGYDYRLTDQFAVGVSYRYLATLSDPALQQSQFLLAVSYGF